MSDPAIEPSTAAEPAADDPTAAVNGLAQLSFAIIPAFVAALAATGFVIAAGLLGRPYRVAVGPPAPDLSAESVEVASDSGSVRWR